MMLRTAIVALTLLGGVSSVAVGAEPQFPYRGYINASDVYLRSGPGDNYYPVSKLSRGQAVEIYRHDPGGWYAIRPTEDCFSWISGEFLKPAEGNLAVVDGERVVARVGSTFSDIRDVIQVHLDPGETVEVIEAKRFNAGPAAQTWYKIAPPAGEFRWVSGKFIDRELPETKSRQASPDNNLLISRARRRTLEQELADDDQGDESVAEDEEEYPVRRTGGGAHAGGIKLARHEREADEADQDERDPLRGSYGDDSYELDRRTRRRDDAAGDRARRGKRPAALADDEIELDDADLSIQDLAAELDLELSAMVAEEPSAWNFTGLKKRAETALTRAETALDRGRIRRVLRKIENFDDLQRRYDSVMNVRNETNLANGKLKSFERPTRTSLGAFRSGPRYDGSGRLTQVLSRDPRSPQFALLNENGQVAYYVSPSPGVNLRRYLNQEVGIHGALGYLPEQRAQHVTAQRIVSLDSRTMR